MSKRAARAASANPEPAPLEPDEPELAATEPEPPIEQSVPLGMITLDPMLQPRQRIDPDRVAHYAELLQDGTALPLLTVVFDGVRTWLADGFHRYYGHQQAGLEEARCLVHFGSKTEALRLSLGANADHGQPRTGSDLARGYQLACQHQLVDPADADEVRALLRCTDRYARELTKAARDQRDAERLHVIVELRAKGATYRQIAARVGLGTTSVKRIVDALGHDPRAAVPFRNSSETVQPDPEPLQEPGTGDEFSYVPDPEPEPDDEEIVSDEELDGADELAAQPAEAEAGDDPIKRYLEEQARTAPQREMWGNALRALEEIVKQPSPEMLFANRSTAFDHLFGTALDEALAWITGMKERWNAEDADGDLHGSQDRQLPPEDRSQRAGDHRDVARHGNGEQPVARGRRPQRAEDRAGRQGHA
jgi:hypothetical protein